MSKEKQAEAKQHKAQRPSPLPESPVAELTPVHTGLENPGQLSGLPAVPSSRGIRQATVLRMQQQQGNASVQRMLARTGRSHTHAQPITEIESDESSEFAGAGVPTLAPAPPPPNGNATSHPGNGVPSIQREEEGSNDDRPTEAEKAAALAKARAAEALAGQKADEAHQETDKANTAKEAEKQVRETNKTKAEQAKGEAKQVAANGAAPTAPVTAPAKPPTAKPSANGAGGAGGAAAAPVAAPDPTAPDYVAPKSPEEDTAFQGVTNRVKETAVAEKEHAPATDKANEAAAAAEMPASEVSGRAQNNQAGQMENAPTPEFDGAAFKARLMQRIQEMAPKTAEEADEFKESNKLDGMKGEANNQVSAERDKTKGPMEEAAGAAPDTGAVPPKPVTPIPDADPGAAPPPMGAETAVPKQKGVGEVEAPLAESSQSLDNQMADAEVTEDQLANSNEPEFTGALESKEEAQTHAREAPTEVRAAEQEHITSAQTEATAVAEQQTQAMHTDRASLLGQVEGRQETAQTADEQARAKVGADINTIYEETKTNVEAILDRLDGEVSRVFEAGAEAAKKAFEDYVDAKMEAYKEERYGGFFGWAQWLADKIAGMPSEVNAFYAEGRNLFIREMDAVIDNVVAIIGRGMAEAKAEIANGRKRIQDYIAQLPQDLQAVGQEAADNIQSQFDQLEQSVNDKQNALIDTLASKYQEHLQAVDARIEEMKAANAGLIDRALNAIVGVIKTILELKEMLLNVLARAAEAIGKIIGDPIGFLGNLINAIKQGFSQFIDNIGTHLQQGFISWLTGALGGAGITLPQTFDLPGILQLVMQILGISFEQIMGKVSQVLGIDIMGIYGQIMELVNIYQEQGMVGLARYGLERLIGAEGVEALMEVVHIFQVIQSGDFGQLWEIIQQHLSDLKEMIFGKIEEFIVERVIKAGITWLISLFNPAGAFIRACKMIYDVVMFFIERGSQIMSLVNAIIDSITSIASGNISAAANFIEQALARAIPVAISFLSSLLGLGNISEKVQEIIQAVRTAVDNAIDRVLNSRPVQMVAGFIRRVVGKVKNFVAAGVSKLLGFFGVKTAFTTEDGESHELYYEERGDDPVLMVASTPKPIREFLDFYVNEYDIKPNSDKGAKVAMIRSYLTTEVDPVVRRLKQAQRTNNTAAIESIQGELLEKNTALSQQLRELLSGDRDVGKIIESYLLEGMTGTYATMPVATSDQLTPDHQPQAAILEWAADRPYFGATGNMARRAASRASQGYAVNLYVERHMAGRTYGSKGDQTKNAFIARANAEVRGLRTNQEKRDKVVDLMKGELSADVNAIRGVVNRGNTDPVWADIHALAISQKEKDELINKIRANTLAGEAQIASQDLDSLKD